MLAADASIQNTVAPLGLVSLSVTPGQELQALRLCVGGLMLPLRSWIISPRRPRCRTIRVGLPSGSSAIGLPTAWNVTTGSAGVIIAVVDSGVYLGIRIWRRKSRTRVNWAMRIDDDLNGKWTMCMARISSNSGRRAATFGGDAVVSDQLGHGTHVAGIAAAATNIGIGSARISWGARVMPVRVLDHTAMASSSISLRRSIMLPTTTPGRGYSRFRWANGFSGRVCEGVQFLGLRDQGALLWCTAPGDIPAVLCCSCCMCEDASWLWRVGRP